METPVGADAPAAPEAHSIDGDSFKVLVNAEGQYSIWPSAAAVPAGWSAVGPTGPKASCTAFIEAEWTDMRPLSLGKESGAARGSTTD